MEAMEYRLGLPGLYSEGRTGLKLVALESHPSSQLCLDRLGVKDIFLVHSSRRDLSRLAGWEFLSVGSTRDRYTEG